jgi:hypothetical protein
MPLRAFLYAFTLFVVGSGSAWFHATLSFSGQFFDVLGMYLIGTFALLYSIGRIRPASDTAVAITYLLLNAVLSALLYWMPIARRVVFGLLIAAVIAVEMVSMRRARSNPPATHLRTAIAVMALAFAIWILDYTKIVCDPNSWLQGHAIWHMLGAVAAWFLFLHYDCRQTEQ